MRLVIFIQKNELGVITEGRSRGSFFAERFFWSHSCSVAQRFVAERRKRPCDLFTHCLLPLICLIAEFVLQ